MTLNWKDGSDCQAQVPKKYWDDPNRAPRLGGAGSLFQVQGGRLHDTAKFSWQ